MRSVAKIQQQTLCGAPRIALRRAAAGRFAVGHPLFESILNLLFLE
jgi:hypothetical protein